MLKRILRFSIVIIKKMQVCRNYKIMKDKKTESKKRWKNKHNIVIVMMFHISRWELEDSVFPFLKSTIHPINKDLMI